MRTMTIEELRRLGEPQKVTSKFTFKARSVEEGARIQLAGDARYVDAWNPDRTTESKQDGGNATAETIAGKMKAIRADPKHPFNSTTDDAAHRAAVEEMAGMYAQLYPEEQND